MALPLEKADQGREVRALQKLLVERSYPVDIDGDFGSQTYRAVRAFQAQNLDQHGQPLVVDGKVSPNVQGFLYVFSRMEKLLGYGHVP